MNDPAVEYTARAFEYWGAFAFVVILQAAIIWWLLRHNKAQRETYQRVIDALNEERKYWTDIAFRTTRESSDQIYKALEKIKEVIDYVKERG